MDKHKIFARYLYDLSSAYVREFCQEVNAGFEAGLTTLNHFIEVGEDEHFVNFTISVDTAILSVDDVASFVDDVILEMLPLDEGDYVEVNSGRGDHVEFNLRNYPKEKSLVVIAKTRDEDAIIIGISLDLASSFAISTLDNLAYDTSINNG